MASAYLVLTAGTFVLPLVEVLAPISFTLPFKVDLSLKAAPCKFRFHVVWTPVLEMMFTTPAGMTIIGNKYPSSSCNSRTITLRVVRMKSGSHTTTLWVGIPRNSSQKA